MAGATGSRMGDVRAMVRLVRQAPIDGNNAVNRKRRLLADLCRLLGAQYERPLRPDGSPLPPRLAETLTHLLGGDSEKEIARRLGVSRNTVHVYVTSLYRHYEVSSRGELLARFVRRPNGASPEKVIPHD